MKRILCVAFAFFTSSAFAQTFTWHLPNYGEAPQGAGLVEQSIAFDTGNNAFVLQKFLDVDATWVRVEKFFRAAGVVAWQADFPAVSPLYFQNSTAPAAIAAVGDDAYVTATNQASFLHGSLRRLNGSDGSVAWLADESVAGDFSYDAVATDASGDAIVTGAVTIQSGAVVAHAVKFAAADGALLWRFDDDADSCGTNAAIHADAVAVDASGNVVLLEQATSGDFPAYVFCVVKLDGATGVKVWSQRFVAADGVDINAHPPAYLRLDAAGNAAVSAYYDGPSNGSTAVVAHFDAATGALTWKHDWLKSQSGQTGNLALDAGGNVILSLDTTQVYAAADGAPRWATPAPDGGAVTVTGDGTIVVAHNDMTATENAQMQFNGLDPATGSAHWHSAQTLPTFGYWATGNEIAADGDGAFLAVQLGYGQTTLLRAQGDDGTSDWVVRDYVIAAIDATLEPVLSGSERLMAKAPDGTVVVAAVAGNTSFQSPASGRWMVVKRSTTDGHTVWTAYGDPAQIGCVPHSTVVDAHGDVVVGVTCGYDAQVIKLAGATGAILWIAAMPAGCVEAFSQSVSADAVGDVYSTQTCFGTGSSLQITAKYSGATGVQRWKQSTTDTSAFGPYNTFVRGDSANGVIVVNTTFTDVIARKLRADTGALVWNYELTDMVRSSALALFANNDALIVGGNSRVVRLNTSNGQPRWDVPNNDLDIGATAIDAAGNVFTAGDYVIKFDGASGQKRWSQQLAAQLHDVTVAPDGSAVVTGWGYGSAVGGYVGVLESATGAVRWSLTDTVATYPNGASGVVVAADGGIIVSEPTSGAWMLTRITGKFADDVFAGGFEP